MASELRKALERRKGQKELILAQIGRLRLTMRNLRRDLVNYEQAREIIKQVELATQQKLQTHISSSTSLALAAILPQPYVFQAEFVLRRNKSECDLRFLRNGQEVHPLKASGGGAVDVAAFALRPTMWAMQFPRTINTMVFDEPFKHLSVDRLGAAGEAMLQVAEKTGLQIIMITHLEDLSSMSNSMLFEVTKSKGVSKVNKGG